MGLVINKLTFFLFIIIILGVVLGLMYFWFTEGFKPAMDALITALSPFYIF